jgi:hypothetical protein
MQKRLITAGMALLVLLPVSRAAEHEIWARSRMGGANAGFYHESAEVQPDGKVATSIENDFVLNRLGSRIEMKSTARYLEAKDGRLVAIDSTASSSAQSTTMHVDVEGRSLAIRTTTGGKSYERSLTAKDAVLGPEAARRLTVARLKSPGDVVSYETFSPELASLVTVTEKCVGTGPLKIEASISGLPTPMTVWLDDSGWLLRQTGATPFGSIDTVRGSEAEVKAQESGATLPSESFTSTLVKSNVRLPEERLIEELEIRITQQQPDLGWPDLSDDNQTVLESARDHVVLRIRRITPRTGGHRPMVGEATELRPFLNPNPLVQSDDAEVRKIARSVAGDEPDAYAAARKLQQWTNEHMSFDAGVAAAPASEIIRNRRGTCLGYAILLASLLRADGIPSRIRMGFVYAGGIWGGHAWVEMLAGSEWVPLDAALYSPGTADAARFSLYNSALEEGAITGVGALAMLYGHVGIEILGYTIHGRHVTVAAGAKPFVIDADTYRNQWLGLTFRKPAAFRFTELESVWPKSTVLAIEGPGGESLEIQSHSESLPASRTEDDDELLRAAAVQGTRREVEIGGRMTMVMASETRAAIAIAQGGERLVVIAKGPKPVELLAEVASTLRLDTSQ